jgi:hypothetical protein
LFLPFNRLEIAALLRLASDLDDAPQACSDKRSLVGLPLLSLSGPALADILAKNDALRGLSPDFTGGFKLDPVVLL